MSLMLQPLRRYADFNGRASRTEFWLFQLFMLVLAALLVTAILIVSRFEPPSAANSIWDVSSFLALLGGLAYVALIIPRLAVLARRLHDSDNSGFWIFAALIPAAGGLILLVMSLLPGTKGANRHGHDPRHPAMRTTVDAETFA